jgi:aspartyl-tRNA(Asn)/glutamyl-tRNA(Gln) amidotransferase subunit C
MQTNVALTAEQVQHVASLSRLALTESEIESLRQELSAILEYASIIETLDTTAILPTASVLPLRNVLREDKVAPSLSQEDALANAPCSAEGHFSVQAILE